MQIYFQSIANNPLIGFYGLLLGIIGIILGVYLFLKSKKDKLPYYHVVSNTLIEGVDNSLTGLEIQFNGKNQKRITITKITFWNAGDDTIDKNDVVPNWPICIYCDDNIDILDTQVLQVSNPVISVKIADQDKIIHNTDFIKIPIYFEYLDRNDFCVFQIVHNGKESDHFGIYGKIKGAKNIDRYFDVTHKDGMIPFWIRKISIHPEIKYYFTILFFTFVSLMASIMFMHSGNIFLIIASCSLSIVSSIFVLLTILLHSPPPPSWL